MKREHTALILSALMIVAISLNAFAVNKNTGKLLEKIYALPDGDGVFDGMSEREFEAVKTRLKAVIGEWEKLSPHLSYILRYGEHDKINTSVFNLYDSFVQRRAYEYLSERKRLAASLERQKNNELPRLCNIF